VTTLAIEINDASLVVANAQRVLASEPGYALVDKGVTVTGTPAYRQGRLKPRYVSNGFWNGLSLEPGSAGVEGVASAADLAYAQLDTLWKGHGAGAREVVLVVPARYGAQELGLLLGLAQECGMPVRAMVDAAVAASAKPYPRRQLLYVDAGLHRVSVTSLRQGDDVAARPEHALETTGLANLIEILARRVAEIFVLATRFDPFRQAESEQLLYDRLPEWLRTVHDQGEAELTLQFGGETYAANVSSEQLLGAASGFYRAVVQLIAQSREPGQALTVQLSDRLVMLPGLVAELARLDDAHVVSLPPGHAARAVLLALTGIDDGQGQVKLLKHLPWRERADEPQSHSVTPRRAAAAAALRPTHVVYRGIAHSIDARGIVVGRTPAEDRRTIVVDDQRGGVSSSHCEIVLRDAEIKVRDLSRHGTFVNEKRISGDAVLHPADVIRIGTPGAELMVIRVEAADGTAA
jgi:hypothetical protein